MNAPVPARALCTDRFDAHVAEALADTTRARHTRDRLIEEVDTGHLDHMLLRARPGFTGALASLTRETECRAARNVIDFTFEPLVLKSLSSAQSAAYFEGIHTTLRIEMDAALHGDGPVWLDTLHHTCSFSVMQQVATQMARLGRIDQAVLLHQGQRPELRLRIVADSLRRVAGLPLISIPLRDDWLRRLAATATPNTLIYYLADMPPAAFGKASPRARAGIALTDASFGAALVIETLSASDTVARRLGADRFILDYPAPDRARIRPHDGTDSPTCPIADWAFWPLLGALYPPTAASP